MKQFILKNRKSLAAATTCLLIAGATMSFQNNQYGPLPLYDSLTEIPDTLPRKQEHESMTMKEYEALMKTLDQEMKKTLKELGKIDVEKINGELQKSLAQFNSAGIRTAIDKALRGIDFASMEKSIRKSMNAVEWDKMSDEIKHSLDKAKGQLEQIDMKAIEKELETAKKEIEKSKAALSGIDLEKLMKEASNGIIKTGEQLRKQKEMFSEMEKDGLIQQENGCSIEYENNTLYIDGKKQPDAVLQKYRSYFDGDHYKMTIKKDKE
jgi:5-bromo-4-chloroindolyl phosphate hydrolysis protein